MEDVIPESESLLLPVNLRHTNGGANTEGHGAVNGGEGTAKGSVHSEQGEDKEVDAEKKSMIGGTEEEEEKGGGGIITHLISIVSPRSAPKGGDAGKRKGEFKVDDAGNGDFSNKSGREGGGGENGNGGVFSNLISNFFNQSNGGGEGGGGEVDEVNKEDEKVMKDIGNKRMKTAEEGGGGGGIIDNIISHIPTSLPDDAAPTTDEASILITSIVKD
ncbi:uncharacterized protein [Pyrus communis]|uniref:uncharacterized protein n=1 Tax=Pyrus communis TaxID=23211 RepID=UPI0035BED6B8